MMGLWAQSQIFDQVYRTIDSFLWSRLQNQREAEYIHYYYVIIARSQLAWHNSISAVEALITGRLLIPLSHLPTQQHLPAQCKLADSE